MSNFVKLAEGIDVAPLVMAVERLAGVFGEKPFCELLVDGDWRPEYFAFPQLRGLLLDLMRRVECGALVSVFLAKPMEVVALPDPSSAYVCVALHPVVMACGDDEVAVPLGGVVFCTGAEPLQLKGPKDSCSLVVNFTPMP